MTSVNRENGCPYAENDDLLRRYAAGKAEADEADRFEQHFLACDRCWTEMREIAHIRAALDDRKELRRPVPARRLRPILATAAAAALIVLGIWSFRRPDDGLVLRSETSRETMTLRVSPSERGVILSWNAVEGADRYLVQVFHADGSLVLKEETNANRFELAAPREKLYARISALNKVRAPIASSPLTAVR